jgi:hypothetical protein
MSYNFKFTKMDIVSALIILGITIIIVLPFVFVSLHKKQKNRKYLKHFNSLAEKENIVISQRELWDKYYVIGLDASSKKILYTNRRKEKPEEIIIDLNEVEKCRIANISKTYKGQSGEDKVSDRLELVFTFLKSGIPEKSLEFYDSDSFMPNEKEISNIENWLQIIRSNLKTSQ